MTVAARGSGMTTSWESMSAATVPADEPSTKDIRSLNLYRLTRLLMHPHCRFWQDHFLAGYYSYGDSDDPTIA